MMELVGSRRLEVIKLDIVKYDTILVHDSDGKLNLYPEHDVAL